MSCRRLARFPDRHLVGRRVLLFAWLMLCLASRAHADCELLYAPPEVRARLLAFHYANEQRRASEHGKHAGTPVPGSRAGAAARPATPRPARVATPRLP